MDYIVIKLNCDESLSMDERKAYIDTFYNEYPYIGEEKLGFFNKFSKAIGFKDLDENSVYQLLTENSYAYSVGNTIMEFYFKKERIISNDTVSYTADELTTKWANFMKKIFPQLEVSIMENNTKPNRESSLISFLFKIIEKYPISSDISLENGLTENELKSIERFLISYDSELKFKLFQYECNTCKEKDPKLPIHLQFDVSIDYKEKDKRCYNCLSFIENIDNDFCEQCIENVEQTLILQIN